MSMFLWHFLKTLRNNSQEMQMKEEVNITSNKYNSLVLH